MAQDSVPVENSNLFSTFQTVVHLSEDLKSNHVFVVLGASVTHIILLSEIYSHFGFNGKSIFRETWQKRKFIQHCGGYTETIYCLIRHISWAMLEARLTLKNSSLKHAINS